MDITFTKRHVEFHKKSIPIDMPVMKFLHTLFWLYIAISDFLHANRNTFSFKYLLYDHYQPQLVGLFWLLLLLTEQKNFYLSNGETLRFRCEIYGYQVHDIWRLSLYLFFYKLFAHRKCSTKLSGIIKIGHKYFMYFAVSNQIKNCHSEYVT